MLYVTYINMEWNCCEDPPNQTSSSYPSAIQWGFLLVETGNPAKKISSFFILNVASVAIADNICY